MAQNYFYKNTSSKYFSINTDHISAKEKQTKKHSFSWMLFLVILFAFLFNNKTIAQTTTDNSPGGVETFTVPANVTSVTVQVWGAGGSGGGSNVNGTGGSGAGGGGYSTRTFAVTAGQTISYTVGTGGAAGAIGANGNIGTASTLSHAGSGTSITANGGAGGNANSTAAGGAGGTATGGTTNTFGSDGLPGGAAGGNGGNAGNAAGTGGAGQTNANGTAGTAPGGGGGGGEDDTTPIVGNDRAGGAGANGRVVITYITISSLGAASGCSGSSITINGTNLTGATAVTIGGTAVASITSNSATQIVAVIGSGTTGTVAVTTPNGTCTFGTTFTVNPTPVITTQPVAPAAVCSNDGNSRTVSVTATGATSYQWRKGGTPLTVTPPYSNVTSATLDINNANVFENGSVLDCVITTGSCSVTSNSVTLTVNAVPSASVTPSPANSATGVCYTGTGSITSVSWAATATATSYDVYFGAGSLPGSVTSNVATNSYTCGTLLANTTYYWKVVAKNACGDATGSSTWTFTTSAIPCGYCTPSTLECASFGDYISNVTINTLNNTSVCTGSYTTYAATGTQTTSVLKGSSYNFSLSTGNSTGNHGAAVWIDFNQNGVFTDSGEYFLIGNTIQASSTTTISLTIPAGATSGATKMRVRYIYNTTITSAMSCTTAASSGETEDYTITIVVPPACVTPTAQPTSLSLTPAATTITGSFTYASPVADNYLVVINTTGTTPTPTNGTTYAAGDPVTGGTVVDFDTNNTFTATGLTASTLYYIFVFSYNSACTGGPLYYNTTPLTGSTTTLPPTNCTPTGSLDCTTNDSITNVTLSTLNNTTTCGAGGYTAYAATGTQTTSVLKSSSYTLSLSTGSGTGTHGAAVWLDFNQDGDFTDAGEYILISNSIAASSTTTVSVPIPAGANSGLTRMRVRYGYGVTVVSTMSCAMGGTWGETEDYIITVVAPAACVTPTAQPTALSLTPASTSISGSFTLASPAADNYLVVINTTGTTPTPTNGTTYAAGDPVTGGTVVDFDTNNTFTATGLSSETLYYIFVFSYNSACTGGPVYLTTSPLTGSTTTLPPTYCTPTGSLDCTSNDSITNVTLNTLNNTTTCGAGGYTVYAATGTQTTSVLKGNSYTLSLSTGAGAGTHGAAVWLDFNHDGDFTDAGEYILISNSIAASSTTTVSVPIPAGATSGATRMRVRYSWATTVVSTMSCAMGGTYGETEDYTITVVTPAACVAPTAQPTALTLTPTGSTIAGSFTYASPAADNYLVVINTTGTTPTPVNGTTYTAGGAITGGTVVDIDSNNTFTATGLTALTTYYIFVFSYNSACTGGPTYLIPSPLTGSTTTLAADYCTSTSTGSAGYINNFSTTGGTANITNNGTGYSATGYGNYTSQVVSQVINSSVNFSTALQSTNGFNIWVDWNNDGTFAAGEKMYGSGAYVSSATGSFTVPGTAVVGNRRMRIRADWGATDPAACASISNGETEDYTFTVIALTCAGNPSSISTNVTSQTTATVTWTAASPAPANGYQYYLSTANTNPAPSATPTGSTAAGVTTVNLTGLTGGTTYYIWIRSNCGGTDGQGGWIGPTTLTQPNCAVGNSTGTTVLGCPSVVVGGVGLNGADPAAITCTTGSCVDLEATYLSLGQTTDYTVESITYNPPYQYNCLKNPVSVNTDDVWSPVVNLPFNFCFYGNTYNKCLVGSNGIISFVTTNAGGATGYGIQGNLSSAYSAPFLTNPGNAIFNNSIYGVYNDIDPSKGGQIGWELITLNTGCRALVASWNDVPMFSDNSILYTGMMVLYENTNVIEVYIKNKQIDGTWNDGNAIVGVKNADGTAVVVAPNRDGLSTNWTATNEAWRFVPSGTSITSLQWYEGSGVSGTALGTTDVINVCPTATTTYTAEVTYTLCDGSTLTETDETIVTVTGPKIWDGSVDTDWDKDDNWTPAGKPTALDCVIIPDVTNNPIVSGSGYNGLGYNLTIYSGGDLTINSNNSVSITDFVNVNAGGAFTIENSASLVQVNNVANTGNILYKRNALVKQLDYVYWSSPVAGYTIDNIPSPEVFGPVYVWNPTATNNNGGQGFWIDATGSSMTTARGYIARAPDTFSTSTAATLYGSFTGVPNNGNISYNISRGSYTGPNYYGTNGTEITNLSDNFNLVGNPYPSAIRASQFLSNNSTVLQDGLRIWMHGIQPSGIASPFYGTYASNYSPLDYCTVTITGASCDPAITDYMIGSGQGFFVTMQDGATGTANITFNNGLRSNTYGNSTFFKNTENPDSLPTNIERHRIWLDFVGANQSDRSLIGYIEGATDEKDVLYDATTAVTAGAISLYSLIDETKTKIQGRTLPFEENDQIPLGYNAVNASDYTIAIAAVDGLFLGNRNIYLEDTELNIIHDLKSKPYVFTTEAGTFNERFILRYKNGSEDATNLTNTVKVVTSQKVTVYSSSQNIKNIVVYDMLGRKIDHYENANDKQFTLSNLSKTLSALIIQITLDDDTIVTEKVTY